MFHVSTKQRLAALRRKYGIELTPPRWARERSRRFKEAAAAMKAARVEATRQIVAALTPAPMGQLTPSGMFATAGGPSGRDDSPTTVAGAPYPSQHLSATDADRLSRSSGAGGGGSGGDGGQSSGSRRWIWIVLLVAIALGLFAWCGLSGEREGAKAPPPAPVQAVAPAPAPEPPAPQPPPPPPAPKQLTVAEGDCLWRLSSTHLGDPHAWRRLFEANRGRIRNPDLIFPGQVLDLP